MSLKIRLKNMDIKNKVLIKNILGTFIVKGGAMLVSLFTMPAYIKFFNNDVALGVWFTMLSVLSWILNFDLGIGNGLRNKLVISLEQNDRLAMKKYISSACFSITGVVIVMMAILSCIIPFINWNSVFNVSKDVYSSKILIIAMFINIGGILIQFIFKNINSILYALQMTAINNLLMLITNILQLSFILIVKFDNVNNALVSLSIVHLLSIVLPLVIAGIMLFSTKLKDCRPNIKYVTKKHIKDVLMLGGMFFFVQVLYMLLMSTNEFIISNIYDPADVVQYQSYYKIFFLISTIFSLILTPLWSMITKAQIQGDIKWLKKIMFYMEIALLMMLFALLIVVFLFKYIVVFWLGEGVIEVSFQYCLWFASFSFIMMYTGIVNTMLNGLGKLKMQFIMFIVAVIIKGIFIGLSFAFETSWIFVVIGNTIAMIPYCIIVHIYIRTRLLTKKNWAVASNNIDAEPIQENKMDSTEDSNKED